MCRLMGYVAENATTLEEIAGPDFVQFTELSKKHGDGWGISTSDRGSSPSLLVEPARAKESEKYSKAVKGLTSNAALLHLRWATLGLSINEGNTHPFLYEEMSFIHNGGIMPPESLDRYIDQDLLDSMRGNTDSEKYFYSLVTQIRKLGPIPGLIAGVNEIKTNLIYSSINAILLTPTKMIVVCEHNNDRIPDDEGPDYYELYYRKDAKGVIVASSGWNQAGWTLLPNHHILVVDRIQQEFEVIAL